MINYWYLELTSHKLTRAHKSFRCGLCYLSWTRTI